MIKKQFTIYLENKPGRLGKLTRMLAGEQVNIEGISVSESTDVGLVQMVPSNAAKTKNTLKKLGVAYTVQDIALLPLKNEPGSLSKLVSRLGKRGININYVYSTACTCKTSGCDCLAIISAPDLKAVVEAWQA